MGFSMMPMGRDPLRRAVTGDPLIIPAQTYNGLMDTLTDFKNRQHNIRSGGPDVTRQTGIIRVENHGPDCDRFSILGVADGPIITTGTNLAAFQNEPTLSGGIPATSDLGAFVVTLEPIGSGKIGRAIISGIAVCQVNVRHDKHLWADVKNGDATQLDSTHAGAAQILYRESGSSGTKWAIVRIGGFGPDFVLAKTSTSVANGGNDPAAKVYIGPPGSEVDSGLTVVAYNTVLGDIASGKWILLGWNGLGFYIAAAEQDTGCLKIAGFDLTTIPGYSSGVVQILGHDASDCLKWYSTGGCSGG